MKPWLPLVLAAALACSNITDDGSGVTAIDVQVPASNIVEVGDTIQLTARAIDRNGQPVPATITWSTPDTTLSVIAATGRITGRAGNGTTTGRVQAAEGTLVSDLLTFTVLGRADSLAIPLVTTQTVPAGTAASVPLDVHLVGLPGVGLANHRVVFTVVSPVFPTLAARTVQLPNAQLVDTVSTAENGTLLTPVTVSRASGQVGPVTATVAVTLARPSGAPVPGSGQQFVIMFE